MSSIQHLREFICRRLTAAAAEIFSEFEKTILRYEEEIDRQRTQLDLCWKPELKLHKFDLKQEPVHNKLCRQETFSLDQEGPELTQFEDQKGPEPPRFEDQKGPEPPQIKVENEELCTNQEEDPLHLKQETDPVLVTVLHEQSEPEPLKEQLLSQSSSGTEDQDQESELDEKMDHTEGRHGNQAASASPDRLFSCEICGITFSQQLLLSRHVMIHKVCTQNSGKLMYCCSTCGKTCPSYSQFVVHLRVHTGEKPFPCETCGKRFNQNTHLKSHMRSHTGEKPFSCNVCEKQFTLSTNRTKHLLTHTGEKPYSCAICGKSFNIISSLNRHMKVHRLS